MDVHSCLNVTAYNVHRLLLTSVVVAVKFHDDVYFANAYYAQVGGVSNHELNNLEASFLKLINWRLHVTREEYLNYHRELRVCSDAFDHQPNHVALEPSESVSLSSRVKDDC